MPVGPLATFTLREASPQLKNQHPGVAADVGPVLGSGFRSTAFREPRSKTGLKPAGLQQGAVPPRHAVHSMK